MKMTQYLKWKADLSKGEVFTPISLVCEILDKIPEEVWRNPSAIFLDPCMGKGTFLLEIVRRLVYIYGYTEDDAKSRVYGYDIRVKYINHLTRRGLKNVRHKDFLNEIIEMEFDVVLGNPPYQDSKKTQGKNSSLWTKFIIKSNQLVKNNGILSFVVPISWFAPSESQKNDLKKVFLENDLIFVDTNCKKYFTVGSTFSYFGVKKSNTNIETLINDEFYANLKYNFIPNVLNKKTLSVHQKLFYSDNSKLGFSSSLRNDNLIENGEYGVWYGNSVKYSNTLGPNHNIIKVIVNKPGYLNPRFDNGVYNTSANNYWVAVNNQEEGENIIQFFNYDICKIIFEKLFKYSGYNSLGVLKMIPSFVKNITWDSDDKFIQYLNFTNEEILYLRNEC
jgi:hypothetical protein